MVNIIDYLKDAQLVADFQHFFGIRSLIRERSDAEEHADQCNGKPASSVLTNDKFRQRHRSDANSSEGSDRQSNNDVKSGRSNGLTKGSSANHHSNEKPTKATRKHYVIENRAFYFIFCFGASLGYEIFYALFFPFVLHNVDSFVGRRLVLIWVITMYIGQALKDIIRWNRPKSPPVVVLEPEYSMEYGMPSTHAMVGFALPFSVFIFTQSRYVYPFWAGLALASAWCLLVCGSRLYLGMHTVLDVIAGVLLSATILFGLAPIIDLIDEFSLSNLMAPFLSFAIVSLMSIYYPQSDRWSPARGDTCVMVGFGYGVQIGSWLNYQLGMMTDPTSPTPFLIHWPTNRMLLLIALRTVIAAISIELIRQLGKRLIYPALCNLQSLNSRDPESKKVPGVEVPLKLLTYSLIGIDMAYLSPIIFRRLSLQL